MVIEANKTVVRRLVAEVLNGGHLNVIDELDAPALVPAARRWITPLRASFPDVQMEIVELIAIFRFRDGKIVHAWSLEDTLSRLQQLGLA